MVSSIYNANLQITLNDGIPHIKQTPKTFNDGIPHTENIPKTVSAIQYAECDLFCICN